MTPHNTDPLGNDGPKTVTPASEVGLTSAVVKNISSAGDEPAAVTDRNEEVCADCDGEGFIFTGPQWEQGKCASCQVVP